MSRTCSPASASATAEDSPASPPPITRTLCEGILLPPAAHPRRQEILNFFRTRQGNAGRENIEVTLFDPRQKAAVGANQSPERGAAVGIDTVNQLRAFVIKVPRAICFEFEE